MFNLFSSPTVSNCTFTDNQSYAGGGMANQTGSSPTVTGCAFIRNSAIGLGGGMASWVGLSPIVTNCVFWGDTPRDR